MLSSGKKPFLLAALVLGLSAALSAVVLEDVVAKVNGKSLLLSEYKKNLGTVLDEFQRKIPNLMKDDAMVKDIRRKVLDQMITDELLAQEAEKLKIKIYARELDKGFEEIQERFRVDEETGQRRSEAQTQAALDAELKKEGLTDDQFRERIRRQLMVRKVLDEQVRAKLKEPEDKKAKEAFEKLKFVVAQGTEAVKDLPEDEASAYAEFGTRLKDVHSERIRVSHILVKTGANSSLMEKNKALEKAMGMKKRIDGGEDFYEIAQKESDDAESAVRGGDLGFILKGWMPPEFEKKAFNLGVGEISDPVETTFGYHLIRVQEKKAKEAMNFEKLKADIKQFLYGLEFQKESLSYVKKLRAQATIEEKLPAN